MSFKEILESETSSILGPKCSVMIWCDTLSNEDRTDFDVAVVDKTIRHSDLWNAMRKMSFPSGVSTVSRHRRGQCTCG